jgi:hypothetical protein
MIHLIEIWSAEDKEIVLDGLVMELETCTRQFMEAHRVAYMTDQDSRAMAYWRARRERVHNLITAIRAAQ